MVESYIGIEKMKSFIPCPTQQHMIIDLTVNQMKYTKKKN